MKNKWGGFSLPLPPFLNNKRFVKTFKTRNNRKDI